MMPLISPLKWMRSALPLMAGLVTSQILGTLFVSRSNHMVYEQANLLSADNWLALPAGPAAETLISFGAAFWGGLFFTLSVGAGLALAAWTMAAVFKMFLYRNRPAVVFTLVIWSVLLVVVNHRGLVLYPSLFVILVPLITGWLTLKYTHRHTGRQSVYIRSSAVIVLVVLTGLWTTQLEKSLFSAIRDNILLSNSAGRSVNDFYYRYTLYAAESFKSFEQKTIRTCRLDQSIEKRSFEPLQRILARHDVLAVRSAGPVDLVLKQSDDHLSLMCPTGDSIQVAIQAFMSEPALWLKAFAQKNDRYAPFRRLVFAGLLIGFPILLYTTVYGIVRMIVGCFLTGSGSILICSGTCLVLGIVLFIPMTARSPQQIPADAVGTYLAADNWTERVAALRRIKELKLEITRYGGYRKFMNSPLVVERYWLAQALSVSGSAQTYDDLLQLVSDSHPNVVCQALYALGRRGRTAAIEHIKFRMLNTDHWYVQWYAYRALRRLGWEQTALN